MTSLPAGTRVGPHEIIALIGSGGMGEVYRATDTRLKRQVALKVLPAAVTEDPDRLARFQREAEVLASLNHPNIAGIYGLEESGGVRALVMELVDGPTLADRIAQGPVPLDEALAIARQIAEALEAAHDRAIIHRDLKPANIKLRPDGTVKVLDFGLAKAMEPVAAAAASVSISPTITSPAHITGAGVILGTAAYMSPEQAAGKLVDRRTDMWAFGVVLLEMLTGRLVFAGETVPHVIASVLKDEPDWSALPADTPASVRTLLRRCLEKDRGKRMPDAAVARLECDDARASQRHATVAPITARTSRPSWLIVAGAAAGALVAGVVAWALWPVAPAAPVSTRFAIDLPAGHVFTRAGRHVIAVSPDGMHLVYVANQQLYLRSFRELDAKAIDGTANSDPAEPAFSPDGQWIAFWASGKLRKIPTTGGTPVALGDTANPYGISWSGDRILIAREYPRAIVAVPANGGAATPLIVLDEKKQEWAQSPQLLDDGRSVLFTLRTGTGPWSDASVVVQTLADGQRRVLVERGADGRVLPSGHLIYAREDTLFVAPFDSRRRVVTGAEVPLQRNVLLGGVSGAAQFAVAGSGTLAYVPDETSGDDRTLQSLTRQGSLQPTNLPAKRIWPSYESLAVSPDGTRVAARVMGTSRTQSDIWVWDMGRQIATKLTTTGSATDPVWTTDGSGVCYEDLDSVLCQPADGSAPAQSRLMVDGLSTIADVSPDGSMLLNMIRADGNRDIWLAGGVPPFDAKPLIVAPMNQMSARVSPDGRWIAYSSDESGVAEVYVRPFPSTEQGRWQVSTTGGVGPRWSHDGRELYFLATPPAGAAVSLTITAVPVLPGNGFATGPPRTIAPLPTGRGAYDVMPDGRLLVTAPATSDTSGGSDGVRQRVVVVQNWFSDLRPRLP